MHKIIKKYITIFSVLLFFITLNVEAGKLKKVENSFSKIEESAKELIVELNSIKEYMKEIDKPGSFLKKTFEGIDHAWYAGRNFTTISTRYPLSKKRNHERNIRNVRLVTKGYESWGTSIKLHFNTLYKSSRWSISGDSKLVFESDLKKIKRNWFNHIKKVFIKKSVRKEDINKAVDEYNQKHVQKIVNLLSADIFSKIDHLYENVYFEDLGGKKLRHEFYSDDDTGRKNRILNDYLTHNEIIKKHKPFLLAGTMHAAYAGSTPSNGYQKNMNFKIFLISQKSKINLSFKINKQSFKLMGDTENEIYSKQNDFIAILDEYVAKGLAIKSEDGDIVQYEDASSKGKYKGKIVYHLKKNIGEWIPPMWSSKDDLQKIKLAYNKAHTNFITLSLQYLDSSFNEIVQKYTKTLTSKTYSNEF